MIAPFTRYACTFHFFAFHVLLGSSFSYSPLKRIGTRGLERWQEGAKKSPEIGNLKNFHSSCEKRGVSVNTFKMMSIEVNCASNGGLGGVETGTQKTQRLPT